tara:strand:- start:866 stop:1396 length:531 start_codon:yes stop_codon:yes gene_type:complete
MRITTGGIPTCSRLAGRQDKRGFSDSLSFYLADLERSPAQVYVDIFGHLPAFVEALLAVRNRLVEPLGFAVSKREEGLSAEQLEQGCTPGLHQVEWLSESEIICTTRDKHMQVSLSVLKSGPGQFTLSTLVNTYSWIGYSYLFVIIPFHKVIALASVRSALHRATLRESGSKKAGL